jgi:hypothetical protein
VLGSWERRARREKEGLRLHGMIALGGPLVVDVWTSRSRAVAVAAGVASSAFVPKRKKGGNNEDFSEERNRLARIKCGKS